MTLNPPLIPGMTDTAEGTEEGKTLAMLATMRMHRRQDFDKLFDSLSKLFAPREPDPEPEFASMHPQQFGGQTSGGMPGQPPRDNSMGS